MACINIVAYSSRLVYAEFGLVCSNTLCPSKWGFELPVMEIVDDSIDRMQAHRSRTSNNLFSLCFCFASIDNRLSLSLSLDDTLCIVHFECCFSKSGIEEEIKENKTFFVLGQSTAVVPKPKKSR